MVSPIEMYDNTQIDVLKTTCAAAILGTYAVYSGIIHADCPTLFIS